jgi:glycosyltransferase involved in cell wall biosynthesis
VIDLSVVVPARNASETIGRTLACLAVQDLDLPYEVVVVDDASEDATAQIARSAQGPVEVVRTDDPVGPGPARNIGVGRSRGAILAFTDADCFPKPDWLRRGLAALESSDLVQGGVLPDPEARASPFDRTVWVDRETGLYETANLFVRRELFEELRGFRDWLPARLGKPLAEDVWFGWRARRAGARTAFEASALVHHAVLSRGARGYLADRRRLLYFPTMTAKIPELRAYYWRRYFLTHRTAAFDLAVGAGVAAAITSSPLPLIAAAPYAWIAVRSAIVWRRHAPIFAAVGLAADAVGLGALALGSVRARTAVL